MFNCKSLLARDSPINIKCYDHIRVISNSNYFFIWTFIFYCIEQTTHFLVLIFPRIFSFWYFATLPVLTIGFGVIFICKSLIFRWFFFTVVSIFMISVAIFYYNDFLFWRLTMEMENNMKLLVIKWKYYRKSEL